MRYRKKDVFPGQFEEEMSLRDWQAAMYQYLVDHSTASKKGLYLVTILPEKDELFRRVKARRDGVFSRESVTGMHKDVALLREGARMQMAQSYAKRNLMKEGPLLKRTVIRAHSRLSSVINRWVMEEFSNGLKL